MGAVASSPRQDAQNWAIIAPNFFISSFFCSDPAREAYSGHSGVRSAPPRGVPPTRQIPGYAYDAKAGLLKVG